MSYLMTRVPLSDDILRGLRWGAFLLAGLAIGVVCYRLMNEAPPKPVAEPAHQTPAPVPQPPPKARAIPAVDSSISQRPVPGPPPVASKPAR